MGATAATTDREAWMSEQLDEKIARIAREAEAAEADQTDRPLPPGTKVSRPNLARSKVLQVRLNPEEFAAVERLADARGLPLSTVARGKLLELLDTDDSGLDVTGQMVAAAARITELAALLDHQQAT